MKRVGLFGGTFDPVHKGHVAVARSFLESGAIDELWVLLTPHPPHKQAREKTGYDDRYRMLTLAFQHLDDISISTIENELSPPSYTVKTIRHLQEKHPETKFYLCIGQDSLRHFHEWYRVEEILDRVNLLVAERPGVDSRNVDPQILEHVMFIQHEPVEASSTRVRKANGFKPEDLPQPVADYIEKKGLYQ
jgi:nicotinate-nucleotide adenylyltransferase